MVPWLDKKTKQANKLRRSKIREFVEKKIRDVKKEQKRMKQRSVGQRIERKKFMGRFKKVQVRRGRRVKGMSKRLKRIVLGKLRRFVAAGGEIVYYRR